MYQVQCTMLCHMKHRRAFIGAAEVATLLGVNRSTVTRWAKAGTLPLADRMPSRNGALIFDRDAVEAMVKAQEQAR